MFLPLKLMKSFVAVILYGALLLTDTNASAGVLVPALEDWELVEVEGRGTSASEAKQDAILEGVRRIVGTYIEQETEIRDRQLIEETIRTFTLSDQVRSEEVSRRFDGDDVVVVMRVEVIPKTIAAQLEKATASAVYMDSETLAAELELARESMDGKKEVLRRLFEDLPVKLGVARLVDRNGKVLDGQWDRKDLKNLPDGRVCLALQVQGYYDLTSYSERALPNILMALEAMCYRKTFTEITRKSSLKSWPGGYVIADTSDSRLFDSLRLALSDPNNFLFSLLTKRSKDGLRLGFTSYELPAELKPIAKILKQESCAKISLVDKAGKIINWSYWDWQALHKDSSKIIGSTIQVMGVSDEYWPSSSPLGSAKLGGGFKGGFSHTVYFFEPSFGYGGGIYGGNCDTTQVRVELIFTKEEFELIDRVVVEFVERVDEVERGF